MTGDAPLDELRLNEELSRPDGATIAAIAALDGDIIILGAGGKMGPTLARMARRAVDGAPQRERTGRRRVIAVSRFSDQASAEELRGYGVDVIRADLADAAQVRALPDAANVLWLAGQKFGTSDDPVSTWAHNVLAPAYAAERYSRSRIVCFSTGNVYRRSLVADGGSRETDALSPDGEYAASCIGRERVFEAVLRRSTSPLLLYRLFYACDLRYGVVTDLALKVRDGKPIDLTTAYANVIWQGDANRLALRSLGAASSPGLALNVTGAIVPIRTIADELGVHLGRKPVYSGVPSADALVANTDRLRLLLPHQSLPIETLIRWTAQWVQRGGRVLGKPTKFEVRDGRF